jgi:hypothetical protein
MLDDQWLKDVRFDLGEGYRVDGIHIGGTNAAIKVIYPDGQSWAIRLPRELFRFASYIRELPNWIGPVPQYAVERLNRKLANIVGEPEIHRVVGIYDTFYYSILESLFHARKEDPFAVTTESDAARDAWRFIIQTPPVAHRLAAYASSGTDGERRAWAEASLRHLKQAGPGDPSLSPDTLLDNPLVVWGGAVSEGFFTKAQLPEAVAAVRQYLNSLPDKQVRICLEQMAVLILMFRGIQDLPAPVSLAVLCDATGFFEDQFATEEERTAPDQFGALLEAVKKFDRPAST